MYPNIGANLLSFPVRTNKVMFLHATCPQLLEDLSERLSTFGFNELAKEVSEFNNSLVGKLGANNPVVFVSSNRNYLTKCFEIWIFFYYFCVTVNYNGLFT